MISFIIGAEAPRAAGVGDDLRAAVVLVFDQFESSATLEAPKAFTKETADAANAPNRSLWPHCYRPRLRRGPIWPTTCPNCDKGHGLASGKGVIHRENR